VTLESEPQLIPEEQPQATAPSAPKGLKNSKKPAPPKQAETQSKEEAPASQIDQIRSRLSELGKTDADLLKICVAEKWVKPGSALEDLSETAQTSILTFWDEIVEALS
jgi:hypothetical protein